MTLFFYIIIGLITFVAFLHAWCKKEYDLSRTIVINRPKAEVYACIRQLKKQPLWLPWFMGNGRNKIKFRGEDGKVGAALYWKGNNRIGEGIQKISKVKEARVVEFNLLFLKPYKIVALSYMAVKEVEPEKTKMVWGVRGLLKFPLSVIMLFYGMENALGADFDNGLRNLKLFLEGRVENQKGL